MSRSRWPILSLLADVRKLARKLLETEPRIHVLVNNAGVLLNQRTTTAEGNETTLATNLLAPYLLTQMLLPRLRESAPSRIINVSSGGMYATGLALDDLQYEKSSLRRQPRLRPHQARARHPDRDLGGTAEGQRRGRPRDASGLGGYAGCRRFAPGVSHDHPALPAHGGARARIPSPGLRPRPEAAKVSGVFWLDREPHTTHVFPGTDPSPQERQELLGRAGETDRSEARRGPAPVSVASDRRPWPQQGQRTAIARSCARRAPHSTGPERRPPWSDSARS